MIPESKFPDLASETENRSTGFLMALRIGGLLKPVPDEVLLIMISTLARLVDGVFIDYQAARYSYYRLHQDQNLGNSLPVSAALVPVFHHIENCISNMERVREMIDAIRTRKTTDAIGTLIDKNEWRIAETCEQEISRLRNAIQHNHNHLREGLYVQGAIQHIDTGHISFGNHILAITDIASCLRAYRRIITKIIQTLRIDT